MSSRFRMMAAVASLLAIIILLRCLWLWQPERQLLLHQEHLRRAVESRDWGKVEALIDPGYSDRWGYSRETGLREARQWLSQFFALTITPTPAGHRLSADGGVVTEKWKLDGTGTEATSLITQRVNSTEAPFVFQWKHRSSKPWDWTLVSVDNPDMDFTSPGL